MEDEKEIVRPEVWFDFHNEYLPSCFALCIVFLNFHFISRPTGTTDFKPSLISLPQRVFSQEVEVNGIADQYFLVSVDLKSNRNNSGLFLF